MPLLKATKLKTQKHDVSHYDDQIAVPDADILNPGNWLDSPYGSSGGDLFDELDEISDVGKLSNGAVVSLNRFNSAAIFRVSLTDLKKTNSTPLFGWQIRFTASADNKPDGFNKKTGTLVKALLYQASIVKASSGWMKLKPLLETWTYALTVAEAGSITDLGDMFVEIVPTGFIDHRTNSVRLGHVEINHTTSSVKLGMITATHLTSSRLVVPP